MIGGRTEPIHHQCARFARSDFLPQEMEQSAEAVLLQGAERAYVHHPVADLIFFEKRETAYVEQHPPYRLGDQGYIQRLLSLSGTIEANLVPQDGFSGSGCAFNYVKPAAE